MIKPETLSKFLKTVPKETSDFVLVYLKQDETEETVQTWYKDQFNSNEFPNVIIDYVQSHCDDEELVCSYRLRAVNKSGKQLSHVRMRATPSNDRPDPIGIGAHSGNSSMQQLVRVIEAQLRVQVAMIDTFQQGYQRLLLDQRAEISSLRRREEKATEFAFTLIEASTDEDKEVAKAQIANKLGEVLERVGERILEPTNGKTTIPQ